MWFEAGKEQRTDRTDGTNGRRVSRKGAKAQRKRDEQMADVTSDLLAAVLAATPDRKSAALRALRGEGEDGGPAKRGLSERFVTQRELVKMLGVSAISLWRWKVPGHELGGRRRFRVSEVLAYLESPEFKAVAEELKAGRREKREAGPGAVRRPRGRPCAVG